MTTSTLFHSLPHQGAKHSWRSFIASRWTHRKKKLAMTTSGNHTSETTEGCNHPKYNIENYSLQLLQCSSCGTYHKSSLPKVFEHQNMFQQIIKSKTKQKTWKKLGISSISFSYMGFILKCLLSQNNISKAPGVPVKLSWAVTGLKASTQCGLPSRELTYPTWGKGKYGKSSTQICLIRGIC